MPKSVEVVRRPADIQSKTNRADTSNTRPGEDDVQTPRESVGPVCVSKPSEYHRVYEQSDDAQLYTFGYGRSLSLLQRVVDGITRYEAPPKPSKAATHVVADDGQKIELGVDFFVGCPTYSSSLD